MHPSLVNLFGHIDLDGEIWYKRFPFPPPVTPLLLLSLSDSSFSLFNKVWEGLVPRITNVESATFEQSRLGPLEVFYLYLYL